jgi:DnaK suppressor protein
VKKTATKAQASSKSAAKTPAKKTVAKTAKKTVAVKESKTSKAKPEKPVKATKAVKPSAKPPVKSTAVAKVPKKAPAKKATQPAKPTPKVSAAPKSAPVPLKKPAASKAVKAGSAKTQPPVSPKVVSVTATKTANSKAAASAAAATQQQASSAAQAPADSGVPARSTRPSSRLTQLTVPSMDNAAAVASKAAKASFSSAPALSAVPSLTPVAIKKDPKLANNWKTKPVEGLSDAEVIAMPDDEYMNAVQTAFFRLKLVQLRQSMLNNAGQTTEHLREDTVVVPDPADRATIEEEHALELRTRDRERKLLKKIEQSIARIDAGDYGYCDETGEPIGVGRLLARPTATLSLEAQQRRELKQKMFGD